MKSVAARTHTHARTQTYTLYIHKWYILHNNIMYIVFLQEIFISFQ